MAASESDARPPIARLTSGVPGLDELLDGGLLVGSVALVRGPSGSGKTILGNQVCHHHVTQGGKALFVTLLAENHARMLQHMSQLDFYRADAIPERLYIVSAFRMLEESGLKGLLDLIRVEVQRSGASLVVLDGLNTASSLSPDGVSLEKFIHGLQSLCACTQCTVLLLSAPRSDLLEEAQVVVDGLIELGAALRGRRLVRSVTLRKMRGTALRSGRHSLRISSKGIEVFPRIESIVQEREDRHTAGTRQSLGLKVLDDLCAGGVTGGSTTLLLGPPGIGKTTFGLHFLEPCSRAERGLVIGFYETPTDLAEKARHFELSADRLLREGDVEMVWFPVIEASIDEVLYRAMERLRQRSPRRVLIDGFSAMSKLIDRPERNSAVFTALATEIQNRGAVALLTAEVPTRTDSHDYALDHLSLAGISAGAHNILALRYLENDDQRRRTVSVLKLRHLPIDRRILE